MQWKIPLGQRAASGCPTTQWRCFWGTQGFPGSPVLGVVVLFACAQARYSVPEPRVCGRLRLRRLSEGSQVTSCYKGSTYFYYYAEGVDSVFDMSNYWKWFNGKV